ncbi:MAG: hypothetical protein KDC48_05395 [Planctomycetes bacterium]|nr:hypothetical protein [Planctomycetota bacterium]
MEPTPAQPTTPPRAWLVLLAAAGAALLLFGGLTVQRLPYPFELEWMEGAMADHAWRVAAGEPLYCAPTPEHVPFLYAPLLFWLAGLLMKLGVPELLALRGIACGASVGVAMLVGHWVRQHTGRLVPGLVATGVFLAGYGWLWWWYDLARNDSLFLLAILGTAYALQHGGKFRVPLAAVLAVVAMLAKQSAAMWLPAIAVGALCLDWRLGLRFAVAAALGILLALGVLHWSSGGWSTFYMFTMPQYHGIEGSRKLGFWTEDILPMLPLLLLGLGGFVAQWRAGERKEALFLAAVGSGGLMTSWASRLHTGGFDNVLVYGFAAACVLGPAALRARARWLEFATPALLAVQFVILFGYAWQRSPNTTALPSAAHRQAHEELTEYVRSQPGMVIMPGHGAVTRRAGKPSSAHGQAIFDLLQVLPRLPDGLDLSVLVDDRRLDELPVLAAQALRSFRDGLLQGMTTRRFGAIVLDAQIGPQFEGMFLYGLAGPDGRRGTDDDLYRRRDAPILSNGTALNPLMGYSVNSPYALEATPR